MMVNQIGTFNLPPLFENGVVSTASAIASPSMDSTTLGGGYSSRLNLAGIDQLQNMNRIGNYAAALQMPLLNPMYIQYLRTTEYAA